eukprot:14809.XXX_721951_722219_1 [CDS] Oithona nana genome sequencing.
MDKFLQRPRSTSVGFDHAKNWPMPKFVICPAIKDDILIQCGFQQTNSISSTSDEYNKKGKWVGTGQVS